jgi:hypothetical protein
MHLRALIAFLLLLWSPAAFAQSVPWRVTEAAGQVELRRGTQAVAARRGAVVAPGDLVSTGPNGRAVLVRGRDFVIVSPRTQLRVPGAQEEGGSQHLRMVQASGRARYRIERRATPHFGVRTPHLVALVKGTVFTVTVGEEGASVSVSEGRVEVTTLAGGMSQMVEPGFAASVSARDPERLTHGESVEARAEMARGPRPEERGRSEDRRNDEGQDGNASAEHRDDGGRHGAGRDAPRLDYAPLDGQPGGVSAPGGNGNGEAIGRVRDTERRLADTLAQHLPNPGGNGGGNADNGGGNGGGSATPPPLPTPVPPVPAPLANTNPGGSSEAPGTALPPPPPPAVAPAAPAPPPPVVSEPAPLPPPPPTTSVTAPTTVVSAPPPPTAPTIPTSPTRCLLGLVCL